MCEERGEQGSNRMAHSGIVPMIVSPAAPQQLAVAPERWADMKEEDETCPERRSLGYCKTTGYAKIWSGVRTAGLVPADTGPALETIPRDSSAAETLCDSGRSQD